MTDEEAQAALEQLSKHFREPVLPLSRFCDAMTTWFRAIEQNNTDPALRREWGVVPWRPEHQHGHSYHEHLRKMEIDIRKSYLLARLLYGGEKLRTRMCPLHKGHWDGPAQLGFPGKECPHGCQGAGWLPETEDEAKSQTITPNGPFLATLGPDGLKLLVPGQKDPK